MKDFTLITPVAFFIFNRPEPTAKVFAEIRKAKPSRLFIIADGPRADRINEKEQCEETRKILCNIDWDCEVIKNFSETNLGCKKRMSSGISWIFENTEEAIFLEDDCLPHQSFFRYCQELLNYYRNDERIMLISGDNFQDSRRVSEDSYYFSAYNHIWGWASWRRAWQKYDLDMKLWPEVKKNGFLKYWLHHTKAARHWNTEFDVAYCNRIDTWDIQLQYSCWINHGLTIMPEVNLISNIGFGPEATHTLNPKSTLANIPENELKFPLRHPKVVMRNPEADRYEIDHYMLHKFRSRVKRKIKELLEGTSTNV